MSNPSRILIVEDEAGIAEPLATSLTREGYLCLLAADGPSGLQKALHERPDLVILDLMLPGMDGLSVCRRLRETSRVPILILTARDGEADEILGLEVGADDYVAKPFSLPVLKSRIRSLLRRTAEEASPDPTPLATGDLVIDEARHLVTLRGRGIDLTATEFALLLYLARHPGQVRTREQLLEEVWGYTFEGYRRTVDSHVNRLRKKLEDDPGAPRYILTVYKVGYRFRGEP